MLLQSTFELLNYVEFPIGNGGRHHLFSLIFGLFHMIHVHVHGIHFVWMVFVAMQRARIILFLAFVLFLYAHADTFFPFEAQ